MGLEEILSEENQGLESLKGIENADDLAKKYHETVQAQNKPFIETLPEELQTDEAKEALKNYEKPADAVKDLLELKKGNGEALPESPEGYEIPKPETGEQDPRLVGWLQKTAHKLKLTPSQVKGLAESYNDDLLATVTGDAEKAEKEAVKKAEDSLKEVWKDSYEANLEKAKQAFQAVGKAAELSEDELEVINDVYGNDPLLARIMHVVATQMQPDGFLPGKPPRGKAPTTEEWVKETFDAEKKG